MIRSALDILVPHQQFTATGSYYAENPENGGGADKFKYEYISPRTSTFRRLFGNIQAFSAGEIAIRTRDRLKYEVGAYVVTADGETYTITDIHKDFSTAPRQALRVVGLPVGVQYVLRMIPYANPWGAK